MSAQPKMPMPKQPVPARAEPKPGLALPVIVRTAERIGGQHEHAAVITRVVSDDVVDVMVLPAGGQPPYPIPAIYHVRHSASGSLHWKWPPRS